MHLLTTATAAQGYRAGYWLAASCDKQDAGIDYMVFDLPVNSGTRRANRRLRRVGGVTEDEKIAPKTLAAIGALNLVRVVQRMSRIRERVLLLARYLPDVC